MSGRIMPTVRGTLIFLVIGALIVGLVWFFSWRSDHARRADPGHVETSESVVPHASLSTDFAVPGGQLQIGITVGDSVSGLESESVRAPEGGHLVGVQVSDKSTGSGDDYDPSNMSRARLWLQSGDERILVSDDLSELPDIGEGPGEVLAFGTGGRDLVAELEYAGRRQSVHLTSGRREPGAFASLYRPEGPTTVRDSDSRIGRKGGLEWRSMIKATWRRTPYLAGLGWAPRGREWLVVQEADLRVSSVRHESSSGSEDYRTRPADGRGSIRASDARTARRAATQLSPDGMDVTYEPENAVFDVRESAAVTLRITLTTPVQPSGARKPNKQPLVVSRSVAVPAVPTIGRA